LHVLPVKEVNQKALKDRVEHVVVKESFRKLKIHNVKKIFEIALFIASICKLFLVFSLMVDVLGDIYLFLRYGHKKNEDE